MTIGETHNICITSGMQPIPLKIISIPSEEFNYYTAEDLDGSIITFKDFLYAVNPSEKAIERSKEQQKQESIKNSPLNLSKVKN